jgi:hypothetical protein
VTERINLSEKFASFFDYFSPRTVAQFNGHDVMVTKLKDAFIWHKHDDTDDFFLVIKGTLDIELHGRTSRSARARCTLSQRVLSIVPLPGRKCISS